MFCICYSFVYCKLNFKKYKLNFSAINVSHSTITIAVNQSRLYYCHVITVLLSLYYHVINNSIYEIILIAYISTRVGLLQMEALPIHDPFMQKYINSAFKK